MKRVMCRKLVQLVKNSEAGILLTSYDQLRLQRSELLAVNWGYAILDEGHKIRNPDAEVSPNSQQADIVIIPPHHMLTHGIAASQLETLQLRDLLLLT